MKKLLALRRLAWVDTHKEEDQLALVAYGAPGASLAIQSSEIGSAMKEAKFDAHLLRAARCGLQQEAAASVMAWRSKGAFISRDSFVNAMPTIANMVPCVHSEPVVQGADFVLSWMVPLGLQIPRLLAQPQASIHFRESLTNEWKRKHVVITHDQSIPVANEPAKTYRVKPSCLEAQFCLCGERGKNIWSWKLWMCTAMKQALPTAEYHSLLEEGYVVLRMTGFDSLLPGVLAPNGDEQFADDVVFDVFVHVSLMSWSPYRPTFRRLTWPGHKIDHRHRLHLMGSHSYHSLLEFLAEVVDHDACSVLLQGYELADSSGLLPELNPLWVLVKRIPACKSQLRRMHDRPDEHGLAICDADPGWDSALAGLGDDGDDSNHGGDDGLAICDEGVQSEGEADSGSDGGHLRGSDGSDGEPMAVDDLVQMYNGLGHPNLWMYVKINTYIHTICLLVCVDRR